LGKIEMGERQAQDLAAGNVFARKHSDGVFGEQWLSSQGWK
jgi:hypothetical protein